MLRSIKCLSKLEHDDLTPKERGIIERLLLRLIAEAWHTNEIRTVRPTPFDEAKWGFAMIEKHAYGKEYRNSYVN